MSRNSAGTFSLPAGNPVVTGTTVSSSTHNTTLSDIATELTNSLDRGGRGAMTAPLPLANGTVSLPALTFGTDPDTGVYRIGANDLGLAAGGTKFLEGTASAVTLPLATTAASTLDVTGNLAVNTNKFTVAASSGNAVVAGTLGVTGDLAVNTNKFALTASSGALTTAGNHTFSGSNPASTTGFSNVLTPKNIAKAWARMVTDGAGNVTVSDGFNVTSAACVAGLLTVSLATAVSANGAAVVTLSDSTLSYYVPFVSASTASVAIRAYDVIGAAAVNFATNASVEINLVLFAAQ